MTASMRRLSFWLALGGFMAIAVFLLWDEHEAHLLGALPWLFVLACPLMHVFMHHVHPHRHDSERGVSQ